MSETKWERGRDEKKQRDIERVMYITTGRGKKDFNLKVSKEGCGGKGEGEDDVITL